MAEEGMFWKLVPEDAVETPAQLNISKIVELFFVEKRIEVVCILHPSSLGEGRERSLKS